MVFCWFCYIRKLARQQLRRTSVLIVHPDYRNLGLAKKIKPKVLTTLKKKYPNAKVFELQSCRNENQFLN
jgi:hypothetical protein